MSTAVVNLTTSAFVPISFCLIYFETLLLGQKHLCLFCSLHELTCITWLLLLSEQLITFLKDRLQGRIIYFTLVAIISVLFIYLWRAIFVSGNFLFFLKDFLYNSSCTVSQLAVNYFSFCVSEKSLIYLCF